MDVKKIGIIDRSFNNIFLNFGQDHFHHLFEIIIDCFYSVLAEDSLPQSEADDFLLDFGAVDLFLRVQYLKLLYNLLPADDVSINLNVKNSYDML